MDAAWALREQLNGLDGQPKISVTDMVIKGAALALRKNPGNPTHSYIISENDVTR